MALNPRPIPNDRQSVQFGGYYYQVKCDKGQET